MTQIESNTEIIEFPDERVFQFLSNLNNHQTLMPKEVSEWWSNDSEARLKIQGLGKLHLKVGESKPNTYLKIIPIGATPVDLFIEWIIETDSGNSKAKAIIHAELNMFMRMVAEKPLKSLADYMASKLNKAMVEA
jgi:carbon monoxide dehydrogenase subunit G